MMNPFLSSPGMSNYPFLSSGPKFPQGNAFSPEAEKAAFAQALFQSEVETPPELTPVIHKKNEAAQEFANPFVNEAGEDGDTNSSEAKKQASDPLVFDPLQTQALTQQLATQPLGAVVSDINKSIDSVTIDPAKTEEKLVNHSFPPVNSQKTAVKFETPLLSTGHLGVGRQADQSQSSNELLRSEISTQPSKNPLKPNTSELGTEKLLSNREKSVISSEDLALLSMQSLLSGNSKAQPQSRQNVGIQEGVRAKTAASPVPVNSFQQNQSIGLLNSKDALTPEFEQGSGLNLVNGPDFIGSSGETLPVEGVQILRSRAQLSLTPQRLTATSLIDPLRGSVRDAGVAPVPAKLERARGSTNGIASGEDFLSLRNTTNKPVQSVSFMGTESSSIINGNELDLAPSLAMDRRKSSQFQKDEIMPSSIETSREVRPEVLAALAAAQSKPLNTKLEPTVLTAHVTPGQLGEKRLSSESVEALRTAVQSFQSRQVEHGQIRLLVKPEALGEVRIILEQKGKELSVKFEAEHKDAQKVMEDSIGALRESLASHSIQLSNIEVNTKSDAQQQQNQHSMGSEAFLEQRNHAHQFRDSDAQSGRRDMPGETESIGLRSAARAAPELGRSQVGNNTVRGRLDVRA